MASLRKKILAVMTTLMLSSAVFAAPEPLRIQLCLDGVARKAQEYLIDLLELQLLLRPQTETLNCNEHRAQDKVYRFRQSAREIETKLGEKQRIEVISALYDGDNVAIFSQVEFLEKPSRKAMNQRARALADVLLKAVAENREVNDPFLARIDSAHEEHLPSLHRAPHVPADDVDDRFLHSTSSNRSLGVFLGMERLTQMGFTETFLRSRELMVSKAFIVMGAHYTEKLLSHMLLNVNLRGGAVPLEFLRPLVKEPSRPTKISKMLDTAVEIDAIIPILERLHLNIGVVVSAIFFDSDLRARVPLAPLSTYWQFKEGVNLSLTALLKIFDTRMSVLGGYFPFVQNSSIGSAIPFTEFGWHLGFSAESTVYRSFGLKFMLDHRRELFNSVVDHEPMRVVSSATLAYLGFVGRF